MDKQYIILCFVVLYAFSFFNLAWHDHRIDSAESRIMELEQRVECVTPESLFFDADGNALCLEAAGETE